MSHSKTVQLHDLCDLVTVQVNPSDALGQMYVGLEHLAPGAFEQIGSGAAADVSSSKHAFQAGDILYGKLRPYLDKAALMRDAGICSTELLVLRPKSSVDPRYVLGVIHSPAFIAHAGGGTTGVQHPRTSWNHISSFELPEIDGPEQRKIADLIWRIHEASSCTDAVLSAALDFKRAAMRALFTRGLRGEAQKETEIGPVPESWTVGPLSEMALFQRGFDITKSQQTDGDVPVISSGGVRSFHQSAAATGPGVVIGRKGSIGSLHYVDTDYWPHDTTLWCNDFRGNIPKFVFYRLHLVDMKRLDSGAANPALNRNFLHQEIVSWPEPDEQGEIAEVLDTIDRKIDLHRRKRAVLDELFKTLLHKLMTGDIRIADLDLSALEHSQPTAIEVGV